MKQSPLIGCKRALGHIDLQPHQIAAILQLCPELIAEHSLTLVSLSSLYRERIPVSHVMRDTYDAMILMRPADAVALKASIKWRSSREVKPLRVLDVSEPACFGQVRIPQRVRLWGRIQILRTENSRLVLFYSDLAGWIMRATTLYLLAGNTVVFSYAPAWPRSTSKATMVTMPTKFRADIAKENREGHLKEFFIFGGETWRSSSSSSFLTVE